MDLTPDQEYDDELEELPRNYTINELVSKISVNHTKRELTTSIVQMSYSVCNTIRYLIFIMSC